MVDNLDNIMIERLQLYMKKNKNALPERIIIYRDGVSEVRFVFSSGVLRISGIQGGKQKLAGRRPCCIARFWVLPCMPRMLENPTARFSLADVLVL